VQILLHPTAISRLGKTQFRSQVFAIRDQSLEQMPKSSTNTHRLDPRLETFASAIAAGASKAEGAEKCGCKKGSAHYLYTRPGVQDRIAELKRISRETADKEFAQEAIRTRRKITFDRNAIIMKLADLAGLGDTAPAKSERVQFECLNTLAEIYLLKPKTLKDLLDFHGWTADELDEFTRTREIPDRIRSLIRSRESSAREGQADVRPEKGASSGE